MTKVQELRDLSLEELEANYFDTLNEMYSLLNEIKETKKSEKPHLIKQNRRKIARLLTIINQKQSEQA